MESHFEITLPEWISSFMKASSFSFDSPAERMKMTIELAHTNILQKTGGPFAAAVFDLSSEQWISLGVNLVVSSGYSMAHAETVALSLAQKKLQSHRINCQNGRKFELVTSCEPCMMCMGAILWSGIDSLVCAARDEDVRAIGFDEGMKPSNWVNQFKQRGINVSQDVHRTLSQQVLKDYVRINGKNY